MNQIKNSFSSIEQMTSQLPATGKRKTPGTAGAGDSFADILLRKNQPDIPAGSPVLKFSKHANERLMNRSIDLSGEQLERLSAGAAKAQKKGIVESLVMVDEYAFIVNTRNHVVVTAVTGDDERVFTNIDGAVIG